VHDRNYNCNSAYPDPKRVLQVNFSYHVHAHFFDSEKGKKEKNCSIPEQNGV